MTYLPILLVSNRGLSPTFVGMALGGAALSATAMVAVSAWLVRLVAPSRLMALSLVVIGTSFIAISMDKSASFVLPLCFAFGAADGLYGVLQNALITQTPPADLRAAFIAATASVRNFGKFSAPSILGLSILVFSLEQSFIFLGLLEAEQYLLAIVAALYVAIAAYYYFRLVRAMFLQPGTEEVTVGTGWGTKVALVGSGVLTLVIGLYPEPFLNLAAKSILLAVR